MIDIDKFICSLMAMQQHGFNTQYLIMSEALKEQGLEYKDGKLIRVVPTLKESEDEKRIRRCIKDLIKENTFSNIYGVTKEQCLAWIEKQGEQKTAVEGTFINVDDVREDFVQEVYRVLDADSTNDRANQIIDAFDNLPTVIIEKPSDKDIRTWDDTILEHAKKELEKQGEQKFEEVDNLHNYLYGEQKLSNNQFTPKQAGVFDKHIDKFLEQKPAWNEEDEYYLNSCITKIEIDIQNWDGHGKTMIDADKKIISWLKSLKDRVQPQQEWSEEDNEQCNRAIYMMEQLEMTESWDDIYNWLKSIKERVQLQNK